MDHSSLLDISSYFIKAFKTGYYPVIQQDAVFLQARWVIDESLLLIYSEPYDVADLTLQALIVQATSVDLQEERLGIKGTIPTVGTG